MGHNRSEPITSYGIILYNKNTEGKRSFLLYQRRDSFEYIDFIRGIWRSKADLHASFSLMTEEERDRIRNFVFDELWNDLWVDQELRVYDKGYTRAFKKYCSVQYQIPHILDSTTTHVKSNSWEFPKGKKHYNTETPIECALREFEEETKLDSSIIEIVNVKPYVENFKGSDGRAYMSKYYIGYIDKKIVPIPIDTPQCIIRKQTISGEAKSVQWFAEEEAINILNDRRSNMLQRVIEDLNFRDYK